MDDVVARAEQIRLGVRADDALYRFLRGFTGPMIAGHHLFAGGVDPKRAEDAWQAWLNRVLT